MGQPLSISELGAVPMTYQFSCRATEIEVRDLMRRLVDVLREEKVGEDLQSSVTIAVTEGLNNIVKHALIARPQEIIDLALSVDAVQVFVLLQDGGDAMPGCQAPVGHSADFSVARMDLPEGGFGWIMIRALADRIDYSRSNDINHLRIWFSRTPNSTIRP